MKYTAPDVGENTVAYKGRRYWVIELAPNGQFEYVDTSMGDYVLWDGDLNGVLGTLRKCKNGKLIGEIIAHVDLGSHEYPSFREAVTGMVKVYDEFAKGSLD